MKINVNIDNDGCEDMEHRKIPGAYLYTCKECFYDEEKRGDEPYEYVKSDGTPGEKFDIPVWCHCPAKCDHNIYTCTICWKPVKKVNGKYWYIGEWTTLKKDLRQ